MVIVAVPAERDVMVAVDAESEVIVAVPADRLVTVRVPMVPVVAMRAATVIPVGPMQNLSTNALDSRLDTQRLLPLRTVLYVPAVPSNPKNSGSVALRVKAAWRSNDLVGEAEVKLKVEDQSDVPSSSVVLTRQ